LLIVGFWFFSQQPSEALAPLFFADPAGAVFGKLFSSLKVNLVWWENKTVVGTFAVFMFAFLSLKVPDTMSRGCIAFACAVAEAVGGKTYDNAVIAIPALGSWVYFNGWR
jgi:hypothetical protein